MERSSLLPELIGELVWLGDTKEAFSPRLMGVDVMNRLGTTVPAPLSSVPVRLSLSILLGLNKSLGFCEIDAVLGCVRKMEGEKVVFGGFKGLQE